MKITMSLILMVISFHSFAQDEIFKNHDSVYYNSIGFGVNLGGTENENNNIEQIGLGVNLHASYLMSEDVFSSIGFRHIYGFFDNASGNHPLLQSYNAQLGIKKSTQFFDPFILGEVEFNYYNQDSSQIWVELNTQMGFKAKIKLLNALRVGVSASYLIGTINIGNELKLIQGGNFNVDVILLNKLKVFLDFEMSGSGHHYNDPNKYSGGYFSLGLKYVY
ncbi:MAG: hypothetical protein HRU38_21570 [Saccharospirillaceae bacterium]|nr:hypothetical protein [Pseudomonadales bacterium]NRB81220.1 hypothetical protein [Saccharospirillaceae bacterium]